MLEYQATGFANSGSCQRAMRSAAVVDDTCFGGGQGASLLSRSQKFVSLAVLKKQ